MRWPGHIPAGREITAPAGHIDLLPTLAAACGADLPDVPIDGRNLLPLAIGDTETTGSDTIFWQSAYNKVVRQGEWKLQVSTRPDKAWLYDLSADPTEKVNLAEARPDKVAELQALLDQHEAGAREPLYPYTIEGPVAVDKTLADTLGPDDEIIYWPN